MNFGDVMRQAGTEKLTENGAFAYNTVKNSLLDLFGTIGALRPRTNQEIEDKFEAAFNQDRLLATKMAFYAGNVRGGLGERRTFRIILYWLAKNYPEIVIKNLELVPHFNRWDSLFECVGTPAEKTMWEMINKQLDEDEKMAKLGLNCSLLAKWMPSINTSSKETRSLAQKAMKKLGYLSERAYRKMLSELRAYIRVVEKSMSANQWEDINYSAVPSYAMKNYGSAFAKHDFERWNEYLSDLKNGKKKVNTSVLFPYDLVAQVREGHRDVEFELVEEQWKALPNYITEPVDILVMADVSGSMEGRPMNTSIGLAIYFSQRNEGIFKNSYMTFSESPKIMTIDPNTSLRTNVHEVENRGVGYNTNLEAAFNKVLSLATLYQIKQEDMPKALLVISDMEIDSYIKYNGLNFVDKMKAKFAEFGYEFPKLICVNCEARQDTFLSQNEDVLYISGQSASMFRNIIKGLNGTSVQLMLETLNDPMYDVVRI